MKKIFFACLMIGGLLTVPLFGAEGSRSRKDILNAITTGDIAAVRSELAKEGALDLNTPVGREGRTLLRYAINQLAIGADIIKQLVQAGATVGDTWKRVPEKGIYDMKLIEFLVTHPTATDRTPADVDSLQGVSSDMKGLIKRIPQPEAIPPHLRRVNTEDFMSPIPGFDI